MSVNPYMTYTDLSRYSFSLSGTTEHPEFPVSNLNNYIIGDRFISASTATNQSIIIDFGASRACDTLVIDNHNFASVMGSGNIRLQYADNGAFTSGFGTAITINALTDFNPYSVTFSSIAKRYWRILFLGLITDYPFVGNIFIDSRLQYESTYDWGYREGDSAFETIQQVTLDGLVKSHSPYDARLKYGLRFSMQTEAFKQAFLNFITGSRGKSIPFYFTDVDEVSAYVLLENDLVPAEVMQYNLTRINDLTMQTQRTFTLQQLTGADIFNILETEEIIL